MLLMKILETCSYLRQIYCSRVMRMTVIKVVTDFFDESATGLLGLSWNVGCTTSLLLLMQFYYGDINLARDKFLQEQIKLDDGCIFFALNSEYASWKKVTRKCYIVIYMLWMCCFINSWCEFVV